MSKCDVSPEMHRVREIFAKIRDPYDRYQLTLLLEAAARFFADGSAESESAAVARGKLKCKTARTILPN
jgi:hypothetical protein